MTPLYLYSAAADPLQKLQTPLHASLRAYPANTTLKGKSAYISCNWFPIFYWKWFVWDSPTFLEQAHAPRRRYDFFVAYQITKLTRIHYLFSATYMQHFYVPCTRHNSCALWYEILIPHLPCIGARFTMKPAPVVHEKAYTYKYLFF